jgi:hypothetical protein
MLIGILTVLSANAHAGDSLRYEPQKIGTITPSRIFEMDDHVYSLYHWVNAYLKGNIPKGLTVVHIDAHADDLCGKLNTEKKILKFMNKMKSLPEQERMKKFDDYYDDDDVGIESFVLPAMYLGIIDTFFWLEPDFNFFKPDSIWRKQPFRVFMLTAGQAKNFDYCNKDADDPCGCEFGCAINYFELEKLPQLNRSILLDIDMDTFGDRSNVTYCNLDYTPNQISGLIDTIYSMIDQSTSGVYMVTIANSPDDFSTVAALAKKELLREKLTGSIKKP